MGADWCFTLAYLLGGEAAARLLNLILFLCITALLLSIIRKWLPLAPTLLTVTMFAATPLVQLVTGSLFAENLWALLCLGALVSLGCYREGPDAFLYLAFALAGAAASTKFGALAFLPPFVLIAFWSIYRKHLSMVASAKAVSITLACFLFSPRRLMLRPALRRATRCFLICHRSFHPDTPLPPGPVLQPDLERS